MLTALFFHGVQDLFGGCFRGQHLLLKKQAELRFAPFQSGGVQPELQLPNEQVTVGILECQLASQQRQVEDRGLLLVNTKDLLPQRSVNGVQSTPGRQRRQQEGYLTALCPTRKVRPGLFF